MAKELIFRFLVGGFIVAGFATIGDLFNPKSFAGLFGAAPSVALATLALTIATEGREYAAIEGRSMIGGAAAFFIFACCVVRVMFRYKLPALLVSLMALVAWFGVAFGLLLVWLR